MIVGLHNWIQVTNKPRCSLGFMAQMPEQRLPTVTPRLPLKHRSTTMLQPSPHARPRPNQPSKHSHLTQNIGCFNL